MTLWHTFTWTVARSGGITAYVLLTLSVVLGLALSMQLQSPSKWPRLVNSELHNFLTLLASVFTVVHVLAVWIDPYTHFSLKEMLIPFISSYSPFWMGQGIVALYLGIAIGISTWMRPRIGYKLWRRLHVFTLLVYVLATLHGIFIGSDTPTLWAIGMYVGSISIVGILFLRRMFVGSGPGSGLFKKASTKKVSVPDRNFVRENNVAAR